MIHKYLALFKLFLINPQLCLLTWQIHTSKRTFLGYGRILSLVEGFRKLHKNSGAPMNVAEFGVGRGGSALIFAWLIRHYGGKLHLFDVFAQIPSPSKVDGEIALKRYDDILHREDDSYYGNLPDLLSIIKKEIGEIVPLDQVEIIVGKYEQTLPALQNQPRYDLVHIDCDWYESTKTVLTFLQNHLKQNSIIQVDDYMHWPGSQQAVQETNWVDTTSPRIIEGALVIDLGKNQNTQGF